MLPYWLLYSVYAIGAIGTQRINGAAGRMSPMFLAAGLFAIMFIGLRYHVGGDWEPYVEILDATSTRLSTALSQGDPGYMLLNWLARELGVDIWFVNLCCATVFIAGIVAFAKREPNPWLTVLIAVPYLMIVVGMGYTRQAVAIGLILYALTAFDEGRYVKVAIFVVLAALFHRTAIIIVPLIGLSVVRHRLLIWGGAALIAIFLFDYLISQILERLRENYLESAMSSDGAAVRVVMNIVPAMIFLCFSRRFSRTEQERALWRNFSLTALVSLVGLIALSSSTVVDRLALYLIPIQLLVLGRLPYAFPQNGRPNGQLVLAVIVYGALIQFAWLNFASHAEHWLPYRSLALAD